MVTKLADPFDLICGKKIEGSWGGASHPDEDIPKVAKLCCQGTLPFIDYSVNPTSGSD